MGSYSCPSLSWSDVFWGCLALVITHLLVLGIGWVLALSAIQHQAKQTPPDYSGSVNAEFYNNNAPWTIQDVSEIRKGIEFGKGSDYE